MPYFRKSKEFISFRTQSKAKQYLRNKKSPGLCGKRQDFKFRESCFI